MDKICRSYPQFMRHWHKHQTRDAELNWYVICTLHAVHEADIHSPKHTCTYQHTHRDTIYMLTAKMPISTEQWRASVGAANASRRPCQPKRRLQCWEVFLCILVALLVSTLLPGGDGRRTESRSEFWNRSCIVRGVGTEYVKATIGPCH